MSYPYKDLMLKYTWLNQRDILRLIIKHRNYGENKMANQFEALLSKWDALEDRVEKNDIDDGKFSKLTTIFQGRKDVLIAQNVHVQNGNKRLQLLSTPEAKEILGDSIVRYLPPPTEVAA